MPHRICATVNKKEADRPKIICVKKYRYERLRIAPVLPKRRPAGENKKYVSKVIILAIYPGYSL